MINRKFFFDSVRAPLFNGKISDAQVSGLTAILDQWCRSGLKDDRWLAYMLATTYHETDRTMQPIEEYGKGKGRAYGSRIKQDGKRYTDTKAIFYGRGYVQLTWYENYAKAGRVLEMDLLHNPDLAMKPDVAAKIMFAGMVGGWFTGKKLEDYFTDTKTDWMNARKIINGLDKAATIMLYAMKFHAAISHKD